VQRLLTEMLLTEEMRIGGYKASLTAAKSQRVFVAPQPAFTSGDLPVHLGDAGLPLRLGRSDDLQGLPPLGARNHRCPVPRVWWPPL
jgi:hypothetical protein